MARRKEDKKPILLYGEIEEQLEDFTDEELGQVFRAVMAYANRGEEIEAKDRAVRLLFQNIKGSIDRSDEAYERKCETNKRIAEERERRRREAREARGEQQKERDEEARTSTNVHECSRTSPTQSQSQSQSQSQTQTQSQSQSQTQTQTQTQTKSLSLSLSQNVAGSEKTETEERERQTETERETEKEIDFAAFKKTFNWSVKHYESKISPLKHMTDERKEKIRNLLRKGFTKEEILEVMKRAAASPKLNGKGRKGFIPDFDWIFEEKNFVRILEGNFNKLE